MSGSIIPTPAYKAEDWQDFITQVEYARKGMMGLSLTNYDNNSLPQIASGSWAEVAGSIYKWTSNDSISGSPSSGNINYIALIPGGSGSSAYVTPTWTTTAPVWSDAHQGWYDGTSRYVGGCWYDGTNYRHKFLFDKGRDVLRKFVIDIGDWNMHVSDGGTDQNLVAHGLSDIEKIRSIDVMIRRDSGLTYIYPLVKTNQTDPDGGIASVNVADIYLAVRTGGYFDTTGFDETSYNRGWITIEVEIV
jgi:hypothetical protein